jgi:hypothetical protein
MIVETARRFILQYPEARYKGDKRHDRFMEALEVIEQHKREFASSSSEQAKREEAANRPPSLPLQNPNWDRMRR